MQQVEAGAGESIPPLVSPGLSCGACSVEGAGERRRDEALEVRTRAWLCQGQKWQGGRKAGPSGAGAAGLGGGGRVRPGGASAKMGHLGALA